MLKLPETTNVMRSDIDAFPFIDTILPEDFAEEAYDVVPITKASSTRASIKINHLKNNLSIVGIRYLTLFYKS